jgi:S1-C subfamily serine protease
VEFQSRICPSCERRIPPRIEECRCGFKYADLPASSPAGDVVPDPRSQQPSLVTAIAAVVLSAGACFWWFQPAPSPETALASTVQVAQPSTSAEPATPQAAPQTTDFARLAPDAANEPAAAPITNTTVAPSAPASLEDVVSDVVPAVATISAGQARGTGFFIKPDTVLTNAHVVGDQSSVQLQVGSGTMSARVVSVSTAVDLAVLQVSNPDPRQRTLRLGSASGVRVGEEVVAVGSALGVFSNTVTRGIVSAFRTIGDVTLIQTDAAINPGNSGGPLVNRAGQVIGINSMGVAKQAAEGVAFAVAIDHAVALLNGQTTSAAQTPLGGLQQQMSGGRSEVDTARDRGEAQYVQAVQTARQAADNLDAYWTRYAPSCVVNAARGGDRAWFAALEANGVTISRSSEWDCGQWLNTVRERADEVRSGIVHAAETARHNGVYPGVIRDIRRRNRLEWSGW